MAGVIKGRAKEDAFCRGVEQKVNKIMIILQKIFNINNVNQSIMTEKEKIQKARAEYQRKWRKENPEKVQKHMDNYWLRKFERDHANQ